MEPSSVTDDRWLENIRRAAAPPGGPAGTPEAPDALIGQRIARYTITGVIGSGGMGTVYEAEQESPRRTVALKLIRAGAATADTLKRFALESHILGLLQHPGIAQVYEAGTADVSGTVQPFFAMERVRGAPLNRYAAAERLGTRQRLDLFVKVCDAVQHAHQKGVIHRDLKPGNILVVEEGAEGQKGQGVAGQRGAGPKGSRARAGQSNDSSCVNTLRSATLDPSTPRPLGPSLAQPKVLDFGVARLTDSDIQAATLRTDVGQIVGTIPYMSPEQVSGDPDQLDTRSDVYALGVVLYELLTERLPYRLDRRMVHEAIRIIREEEPTRLSSLDRTLRGDIETIVGKALEKDKERRYATAAALAADIRRYLADEPIAARPPNTLYQVRKFVKRNKVLVAGAAGTFLAVLAGFIVSLALYFQADAARGEAIAAQRRAEREAAKQRSVNALVHHMLRRANRGHEGGDPNVTVRAVMDAATSELERGRYAYDPDVDAAVRDTIGQTYMDLGLFDPAERMIRRVLEIRRQRPDFAPEEHAICLNNLATVLNERARYDEAADLQESSLRLAREALGPTHPVVAQCINNLGDIYRRSGQVAEAERLHREALAIRREHPGEQGRFLAESLNNLASVLADAGRMDEAEPLMRESIDLLEQAEGDEGLSTLKYASNLAALLGQRGDHDKALALLERAVAARTKLLGAEHYEVGVSLSNLASTLRSLGRLDEAEPMFIRALEVYRDSVGEAHPDYAQGLADVALVQLDRGQEARAEATFRSALAAYEANASTDLGYAAALNSLARILERRGALDEAEPLMRRALDILRDELGTHHPEMGRALHGMGEILLARGDLIGAEAHYREALQALEGQLVAGDWRRGAVQFGLAQAIARQGRLAEAYKPFRSAARAIEGKPGVPPGLARDLGAFGDRLYEELDKLDPNGPHADAARTWRAQRAGQREAASSQPGD